MNKSPYSAIHLEGLEFFAYHGVLPEERTAGQRFLIDLDLYPLTTDAFQTDDLSQTVDYAEVYKVVEAVVCTERFQLLERLAERIASRILADFACSSVRVVVHKPEAPLKGAFRDISVEIVRANIWRGFLSLGSNLGDRWNLLRAAVRELAARVTVDGRSGIRNVSSVYETEPLGGIPQGDFLNIVLEVETDLPPLQLLACCQDIEYLFGRRREDNICFGPRPLDIDILMLWRKKEDPPGGGKATEKGLVITEKIESSTLTLPHPRLEEREFVLAPLREIAPAFRLPSGRPIREVQGEGRVKRMGSLHGDISFDYGGKRGLCNENDF